MTRREEIEQAAKQKYPYEGGTIGLICENSIPIFIQGAEWADKTMLERMLKYLEAEHPTFFDHFGEEIRNVMEG